MIELIRWKQPLNKSNGQTDGNGSIPLPLQLTPTTKEGYAYREIFEVIPSRVSGLKCVPGGPSVAYSSAKAIEWDESFKNCVDPSGRAVQAVHNTTLTRV